MSIVFASLLFILTGNSTGLKISDQMVLLIIDRNTTKEELLEYKGRLWNEKEIRLDIEMFERNKRGKINLIGIRVECKDESGTASAKLKRGTKIGFMKDFSPEASTSFSIGDMSGEKYNWDTN